MDFNYLVNLITRNETYPSFAPPPLFAYLSNYVFKHCDISGVFVGSTSLSQDFSNYV